MTGHSADDLRHAGEARAFAQHRREQILRGLLLTPAERLRWLEQSMASLRRWAGRARTTPLPDGIRSLLHDTAPAGVSWEQHEDFLVDRILADGDWDSVRWLRRTAGDAAIRVRILATRGRRLSPRQIRLWQLLLDLPQDLVDTWLADPNRSVWDRRSA